MTNLPEDGVDVLQCRHVEHALGELRQALAEHGRREQFAAGTLAYRVAVALEHLVEDADSLATELAEPL